MNIIILGAGQVGLTLAESLVKESNDVTLVDIDSVRLQKIQNSLDVRTVVGFASYPNILIQAGIEDADMLIAVTSCDEVNLVACQVAYRLFNTPRKLARIRSKYYSAYQSRLFSSETFSIDLCISPEQLVTEHIARLIEYPGTLQVLDFAEGAVRLVAVRPYFGGILVGKTISEVREYMPNAQVRVVAIYRGSHSIPLTPSTVIEIGDEVFVIAAGDQIRGIMAALRKANHANKNIIIAGGGNIGERLALMLEKKYNVKLLESDIERSKQLAEVLHKSTVLQGEVTDRELLLNENIDDTDVFVAVTHDDEDNIMSCIQAKRMGARQVIALITRPAYVDLVEGRDVDLVVSPQQATIGSILGQIRRGDIVQVHSLRRGAAEAIEVIARGDEKTSAVVGRHIAEINLPKGSNIGAIVRDKKVILPRLNTIIEADDHVILFLTDKSHIKEVEQLFEVKLAFF